MSWANICVWGIVARGHKCCWVWVWVMKEIETEIGGRILEIPGFAAVDVDVLLLLDLFWVAPWAWTSKNVPVWAYKLDGYYFLRILRFHKPFLWNSLSLVLKQCYRHNNYYDIYIYIYIFFEVKIGKNIITIFFTTVKFWQIFNSSQSRELI